MKSRADPFAEALAQACAGIGWMSYIALAVNQAGLTALSRWITSVVAFGALALTTWSGMPTCGVYGPQFAPLSCTAARTMSR